MKDRAPPRDFRQEVTDAIVRMLEEGTAPWLRPWETGSAGAMPYNPTTKKPYRGGNVVGLMIAAMTKGYTDPRWCSYKQAAEQGWQVRKGEKATQIEFWDVRPSENADTDADDHPRPRMIHRVYSVFNAQQIDGIPAIEVRKPTAWDACEAGEAILSGSGASIRYGGNRAYFSRATDHIQLPQRHDFPTAEGFYGTACHELIHWSGGAARLNRPTLVESRSFADESYAKEELVAEIGSWLLSAQTGIPHDPAQHGAYVAHWIKALKEDKHEIFRAASAAHTATDYVLGLGRPTSEVAEETSRPEARSHVERLTASQPEPERRR